MEITMKNETKEKAVKYRVGSSLNITCVAGYWSEFASEFTIMAIGNKRG